jgi:hypothetical protein
VKKETDTLQKLFAKGTLPVALNGFYKGSLEKFIPGNFVESVAGLGARLWLPWYGKEFYSKSGSGDNVVPTLLSPIIRARYGERAILQKENKGLHVFPFRTKTARGLEDDIKVFQLDYDLVENPTLVRTVVDELVCVGKDSYLGKAFINEKGNFRLVAFFRLEK